MSYESSLPASVYELPIHQWHLFLMCHCMTVPIPSLLISLSLLAGCSKGQVCACVFAPLFLTCALCWGSSLGTWPTVWQQCSNYPAYLCGCGVLNEVSKFIGGCKICMNVICLALNSHSQCKTFVLGGETLCWQPWCYTSHLEWLTIRSLQT